MGEKSKGEFVEIKVVGSLPRGEHGKLKFRIVEVNEKRAMDIREFLDTNEYKGFTKKGIMIRGEEVELFHKYIHRLIKRMK